mmetsp:Transcript_41929/g.98332  ORF Transcript_41929/g.98332 Transcript_41929/m.98332 type:complete len:602 (+) Transcript_41929:89-1894(+)
MTAGPTPKGPYRFWDVLRCAPTCAAPCSSAERHREAAACLKDHAHPVIDADAPLVLLSDDGSLVDKPLHDMSTDKRTLAPALKGLEFNHQGASLPKVTLEVSLAELPHGIDSWTSTGGESSTKDTESDKEKLLDVTPGARRPLRNIRRGRSHSELAPATQDGLPGGMLRRMRTAGSLASLSSAKSTAASTTSTAPHAGQGSLHANGIGLRPGDAQDGEEPQRLRSLTPPPSPSPVPTAAALSRGFTADLGANTPNRMGSRSRRRSGTPELRRWYTASTLDVNGPHGKAPVRPYRARPLNRSASMESRQTTTSSQVDNVSTSDTAGKQSTTNTIGSQNRRSVSTPPRLGGRFSNLAVKLGSLAGFAPRKSPESPPRQLTGSSRHFAAPENAVIIFDWDDTLCPTFWAGSHRSTEALEAARVQLLEHARCVRAILHSARAVARVAIVTLATNDWVKASARRYLPTLDLEEILRDLDITVHSATLNLRNGSRGHNDPRVVAKKRAMASCLKRMYGWSSVPWNVVSIGDSTIERTALQELLADQDTSRRKLCKTVKLDTDPSLEDLTSQIKMLSPLLREMVLEERAFDRTRLHLDHERGCNSYSL